MNNSSLTMAFNRAELAISALKQAGFTVISVMIRDKAPRIQIARHMQCDHLIQNGQASYRHLGRYGRQGWFTQYGCQVYWSESLH
ncbi:hypothetical protein ABLA30_18765 [Xenorhabdus nematophila]|uniref:Uncharacterized protein n=1 Tax=Xenorhabdus nematophila (strain ATCC 19061 / DSM 3370 / CCUG 14189 / LMG 1036 / NCIMB 9965 / AN6) TaxID=406817 RepID=D3V957_XENNA|nr:hypothetical protein [Xenorhabdus nematophila]CBJ91407.1 conserved hypothetical protein [Xenorhabdus nematophila ATCC 19061]CEE93693.1 conserved hypothetical protein [Xenorhabdus nematophila str. Anatoliense]CEK24228.1 conserved hypothetical protein [Xenorhabdus nematophila AN6/1]